MKKLAVIAMIMPLMLCACSPVSPDYREIDRMQVIRAVGLDEKDGTVTLSAAGTAPGEQPKVFSAQGVSVTDAIENMRAQALGGELLFSHIGHVLLGEDSAKNSVGPYMTYICQSPDIRLDVPVYLVKGGLAGDAFEGVGDDGSGISEVMNMLLMRSENRTAAEIYTAAQIIQHSDRYGSALISAVEINASSQLGSMTAEPAGCGILRSSRLCGYLNAEQTASVGLITGRDYIYPVNIRDGRGGTVSFSLSGGRSVISPVWAQDGTLSGMDVHIKTNAKIVEATGKSFSDPELASALAARLEKQLADTAASVLLEEKRLNADFLGLAGYAERADPEKFALMTESFPERLPELEFTVSVSAVLSATNDLKEELP